MMNKFLKILRGKQGFEKALDFYLRESQKDIPTWNQLLSLKEEMAMGAHPHADPLNWKLLNTILDDARAMKIFSYDKDDKLSTNFYPLRPVDMGMAAPYLFSDIPAIGGPLGPTSFAKKMEFMKWLVHHKKLEG